MKINTGKKRFLYSISIIYLYLFTIAKTLRRPNDWAEAQWLLNYDLGFLRRSFPGTILSILLQILNKTEISEYSILIASAVSFLIFSLVLFLLTQRILYLSNYDPASVLVALTFLTSPYIVMSAHLMGYFDNLVIILTIGAVLFILKDNGIGAAVLMGISVLIHETTIVVGLPAVSLLAFQKIIDQNPREDFRSTIMSFAGKFWILVLVPTFVFLILIGYQELVLDMEVQKLALYEYLSRFRFIEENRNYILPATMSSSLADYWTSQQGYFPERILNPTHLIQIGLPLYIFFIYIWHKIQTISRIYFLYGTMICITLLPLALHVIAWDTSRIWTYPLIVIFILIWGVSELNPGLDIQVGTVFQLSWLAYIFIQFVMKIPLMDDQMGRFSPLERILISVPGLIMVSLLMLQKEDSGALPTG